MEVQDLKHLIKAKNIPKFMIFLGDEWKVQDIYIKQISKVTGLSIKHIDSISDIWDTLSTKSLFSENYLYILRDDKEFMTTEKIYSQIEDKLSDNMLILTCTSADKRLKVLKQYKDTTIEFNALKSDILKQYIQREIALNDRNTEILMEICEYNYGRCLLEIDKINQYVEGHFELKAYTVEKYNMAFEYLVEDGTIYVPPRDNIWNFIKAVLCNKPLVAYELYQELKEAEVPVLSILSNLYNEAKHMLQIKSLSDNKDIAKRTGLTNWQISNVRSYTGNFSVDDLKYLLRLIQKVEVGIKTGRIEESIAVDYILTSFL